MKNYYVFSVVAAMALAGCKQEKQTDLQSQEKQEVSSDSPTAVFGANFNAAKVYSADEMLKLYQDLKPGDTLELAFTSQVEEVCKKKGCWMSVDLDGENKSFVKFKDYAFFVPRNLENSEVSLQGKAFLDVVSVAELRHYAKDGGKSEEEIERITQPKITYSFVADGVVVSK